MNYLETRELAYFVAVAEELHFGRAADRLTIAQPALSKTVSRLEQRLGVTLLERTSRRVSLTASGEALLRHGRYALEAVSAAANSARRAGTLDHTLRLVIKPGGDAHLLSDLLSAYSRRPDATRVEIIFGGATDRADHVRDGRADLALLYSPFDDLTGLQHETLYVEQRVAIVPDTHPLASRTELRLADLAGETMPRWRGLEDTGTGPLINDVPEMTHMILLGRTIALLPASLVQPPHPGLTYIPVVDAPVSRLVLAWSQNDDRPLVTTFVAAACEMDRITFRGDVPVGPQR